MTELWRRCPKCGGNGMSPEGEWCDAGPHLHVVPLPEGALLIEDFDEAVERCVAFVLADKPFVPMEPGSLRAHMACLLRAAVREQEGQR